MTIRGSKQALKEIFVVDGNLAIHSVKVPLPEWEDKSGVFPAQLGSQSIIVQRGGWTKFTTYASFETREETEGFILGVKKVREMEKERRR